MIETLKLKLAGARKSWTVWFNAFAATLLGLLPMLQDALPALQQYVDVKAAAVVIIVGNVLLRFRTSTALQDK